MPIKRSTLGLDLSGLSAAVAFSELYIVQRHDIESNDFSPDDALYELVQTLPAFGVKQMSVHLVAATLHPSPDGNARGGFECDRWTHLLIHVRMLFCQLSFTESSSKYSAVLCENRVLQTVLT